MQQTGEVSPFAVQSNEKELEVWQLRGRAAYSNVELIKNRGRASEGIVWDPRSVAAIAIACSSFTFLYLCDKGGLYIVKGES